MPRLQFKERVAVAAWLQENHERLCAEGRQLMDIAAEVATETNTPELSRSGLRQIFRDLDLTVPLIRGQNKLPADRTAEILRRLEAVEAVIDSWDPILKRLDQYKIVDEVRGRLGLCPKGSDR